MLEEIKTKMSDELTDKEKNKLYGGDLECGLCQFCGTDKYNAATRYLSASPVIVP